MNELTNVATAGTASRGKSAAHLERDLRDGNGTLVARARSVVAIRHRD